MAFNGNFQIVQTSNPNAFTLTDNSTGSDTITARTIYLYLTDGSLLTGGAINWPIVSVTGDTITLNVLPKDYSLSIVVNWTSASPLAPPSTYTKTTIATFTGNLNLFAYTLIQKVAAQQKTLNDTNFKQNLSNLYLEIDNAIQATNYSDPGSAESALDRGYHLQQNQNLFF